FTSLISHKQLLIFRVVQRANRNSMRQILFLLSGSLRSFFLFRILKAARDDLDFRVLLWRLRLMSFFARGELSAFGSLNFRLGYSLCLKLVEDLKNTNNRLP